MADLITYNGVDLAATLGSYPLVEAQTEYSQAAVRWDQVHSVTLNGKLIGCSKADLDAKFDALIGIFGSNFKNLVIEGVGTFGPCKILSINPPESDLIGSRDYSVALQIFEDKTVQDPSHQLSFSEEKNGVMTVTQSVSAKGVNTSDSEPGNALLNAKTFVEEQLALAIQNPVLIATLNTTTVGIQGLNLISQEYNTSIVENSVSATRTYHVDLKASSTKGILRYTRTETSADGQRKRVSYQGEVYRGLDPAVGDSPDGTIAGMDEAREAYFAFRATIPSQNLLDEKVTEDLFGGKLNFSFYYEANEDGSAIVESDFIDSFSVSVEEGSDSSLFRVSVQGRIMPRKKCGGAKFSEVETKFEAIPNYHYAKCKAIYDAFYTQARGCAQEKPDSVYLSPVPLAVSVTKNQRNEEISYSASFDDRYTYGGLAQKFDYTLTVTPSIRKIVPQRNCAGGVIVVDTGINARATAQVSATAQCNEGVDTAGFAQSKVNSFVGGAASQVIIEKKTDTDSQNTQTSVYSKEYDGEVFSV